MIPIRNLYYLFLYAWDRFSEGNRADVGADVGEDLPNLLAKVLASGVRRQLSRGLNRDYFERTDELALPRGKFLLQNTVKRNSLKFGCAVCQFDELSVDTLSNRILKAALRRLHQSPYIDPNLATELRRLEARLENVTQISFVPSVFRLLQVATSESRYPLLMDICRLVMELSLPDESGNGHRFRNVLEDEVRMSAIFEHFVRNFYRLEQGRYSVAAEAILWPATCASSWQASYLPNMLTDVTLRSAGRMIIIDTKFYKETFVTSRFGTTPKIHSGHLYQLQSYLEHSRKDPGDTKSEGILLYPSINGLEVELDYQLPSYRIRVCTLDLSKPWQHVHDRMLEMADLHKA